jgi:hypothetical protein
MTLDAAPQPVVTSAHIGTSYHLRPGQRACRASGMTSLQPDQWHDLFVAVVGASAALTGLIFVAVSIDLAKILEFSTLPARAVETLAIMIGVLVMSVFILVPGQHRQALGAEILGLGLIGGSYLLVKRLRLPRKENEPLLWTTVPATIIVASSAPMVAAGISLLAGGGGGLYWLVAETVFAFTGVILNARILLVEIHR